MRVRSRFNYQSYGTEQRVSHESSGDQEFFQESAFLYWYDQSRKIGGIWRVGNEPNLKGGGAALWSNLLTPDHALFHRVDRLGYSREQRMPRGLTAGGALTFEYDAEDVRRSHWTMRDEGASAQLIAEDLGPPLALFPETGSIIHEKQARHHLEVGVKVRGVATLDGRRYDIDGFGYRDHSWGPRYWLAIAGHRWLTGTLGDSKTFGICAFLQEDGSIFRHGYVCDYRKGEIDYTDDVDILVRLEVDCVSHRGGTATLRMMDGTIHHFEFEPHTKAVVSYYGGIACLDVPCLVKSAGLEGVSDFEISTNPHRGTEPPFDRLCSAVIANGMYRGDSLLLRRR